jgi:hypothetical protein
VSSRTGSRPGTSGTRLVGNGAFLKGVLREGSLQEKPGPSIATEFGILLPGIHDERGTGASLAGIVSQQRNWVAVHFNAAAALAREQHADIALDAVVEGPHDWAVRPVVAFFHERNFGQFQTRSTLFGVIWESKTISPSILVYAERARMITRQARSRRGDLQLRCSVKATVAAGRRLPSG